MKTPTKTWKMKPKVQMVDTNGVVYAESGKKLAVANRIIGESITENYIKYLYVEGLQTNQMQTVFVPTNGMLPIFDLSEYAKEN